MQALIKLTPPIDTNVVPVTYAAATLKPAPEKDLNGRNMVEIYREDNGSPIRLLRREDQFEIVAVAGPGGSIDNILPFFNQIPGFVDIRTPE